MLTRVSSRSDSISSDGRLVRRLSIVSAITIAISVTVAMLPLLRVHDGYYPGGIDAMGFLAKIEKVASNWAAGDFSDWFPWWYNGATTTQYYPPLSTWIPAAIQFFTRDIFATFKILSWTSLFTGGLATAYLGTKLGLCPYSAAASGVLYATGTYTLYTVLGDGTIGRALSLPLFPLLVASLFELCDRRTARAWFKTAILVAVLILVHAMHAYMLFICSGIALLVYAAKWKDWPVRILTVATACIAGLLLTGFWSVPGYLQLDIPGVPAPGVGWELYWTASVKSLVNSNMVGSVALFGLTLLGLVAAWQDDRRLGAVMGISAGVSISLVYGPANPIYRLLPLNTSIAPVRFLNAAYLPCSLLAGLGVNFVIARGIRRYSRFLPVLTLVAVSSLSLCEVVYRRPVSRPVMYDAIQDSVSYFGGASDAFRTGRIVTEVTELNSEQAYFALNRGFSISNGWNIEGTPHADTYRLFNQCYGYGYDEYVLSHWSLWNVRGVIIDDRSPRLVEMLEDRGWRLRDSSPGLSVLQSDEASTYFQEYLSRVLVIGRSSFFVRRLLPVVTEGSNPNPLTYPDEYLDLFDVLYLYDLPSTDRRGLEQWILRWVKQGKKVVVDLSSSTEMSSLFGVGCDQRTVSGPLLLSAPEGSPLVSTSAALSEGTGAVYLGLDRVWMKAMVDNQDLTVCGVRETQHGDVHFIGLHIPRLSTSESKQQAAGLLAAVIGPEYCTGIEQGTPFDVDAKWDSRGVSFDYETDRDTPVLVSVTHTKRWHGTIDGLDARLFRNESLILMVLPSGRHSVRLTYGQSTAVYLGWLVSLIGVSLTVVSTVGLSRFEHKRIRKEATS